MPNEDFVKVQIHLASGGSITTVLDGFSEEVGEPIDLDGVKEVLENPAKPHWVIIGSALVFTQAVCGVEEL